LAVGLVGLGLAAPASAAPDSLPDDTKSGSGAGAAAGQATLWIYKLKGDPAAEEDAAFGASDGTQQDTTGQTPVVAGFRIERVLYDDLPIDLTTDEGWIQANNLFNTDNVGPNPDRQEFVDGDAFDAGYELDDVEDTADVTTTGGVGFANLPFGMYYVWENDPPDGGIPAKPFLVTLPMTDPVGDPNADPVVEPNSRWMYDVYVYPKNEVLTVTKTVLDEDAVQVGDPVVWTVTSDIPETVESYVITDELDDRLQLLSVDNIVVALDPEPDDFGDQLVLGNNPSEGDYHVTYLGSDINGAGGDITITFHASGWTKLDNAVSLKPDTKVIVEIITTVFESGVIPNGATATINGTDYEVVVEPLTKFGQVTVEKRDENGDPLGTADAAGTTFEVYDSLAAAEAGTDPLELDEDGNLATTDDAKSSFTVGENGRVVIPGLRYSNWENGSEIPGLPGENAILGDEDDVPDPDTWKQYWLVETVAPDGYELRAEPMLFYVTAESSVSDAYLGVNDIPKNAGFPLPFTGGPGVTAIYFGGLVLAVLMVALIVRRKQATA
jgi:fimbrial isopeptide formation D2 family protein